MKFWLLSLFTLLSLLFPSYGQASSEQTSIQDSIKHWSDQLSTRDNRFLAFPDAAYEIEQFTSNSHLSLVLVKEKEQSTVIGYMVVHQDADLFYLLEYGLGEFYLFNDANLTLSPDQKKGAQRNYASLESLWVTEDGCYDAKSGEAYPQTVKGLDYTTAIPAVIIQSTLQSSFHKPEERSYGWIRTEKYNKGETAFLADIKEETIYLKTDCFEQTVKAPFEIVGYHKWDREIFMELDDMGSRFIPYFYATAVGDLEK